MPKVEVYFKSPAKFLNNTVWTPLWLALSPTLSPFPAPETPPEAFLSPLPSFCAPVFHLSFNLASQASLVFLQTAITQTLGDKEKFKTHPLLQAESGSGTHLILHQDSFSFICVCPRECEKPVAEGFCHQSISWINQVVRPWRCKGQGLAAVPVNFALSYSHSAHFCHESRVRMHAGINISCEAQSFCLYFI